MFVKFGLLIATITLSLFSNVVSAEALFKDCEDIAADNSYRLLQKYISTRDEGNVLCQRLDENEFLYTTGDNIYYCKSDKGVPLRCEANEKGQWLSDLELVKKFGADKGQQFVLFKSRSLSKSNYRQSYRAFFLVPKTVNPRGYSLLVFADAGAADSNNGSGACDGINDSEVVLPMKPPVEIVNENQSNVTIRFNQQRTSCRTREKSKQTLEYIWQNGSFKQTKNLIEKIKAGS
jgi:hypothetical protein